MDEKESFGNGHDFCTNLNANFNFLKMENKVANHKICVMCDAESKNYVNMY